jgi:hypothetical protein
MSQARSILFAFPLESRGGSRALALASSLRHFGGELAQAPLVAILASDAVAVEESIRLKLQALSVEFMTYEPEPRLAKVTLGSKADAAGAAEVLARTREMDVLAWMDLDTLILQEPAELRLPAGSVVAFRPVHHRLIGSRAGDPLDPFWASVLAFSGVDEEMAFPVISTVDRELIRFYPNAGCLAVRPQAGLLAAWQAELTRAAEDPTLLGLAGMDPKQGLFLHQAVLAGTLVAKVPRAGIRELSFMYNYPVHLHRRTPENLRPGKLEDLVTVRYEDFDALESSGLPMAETTRQVVLGGNPVRE